MRSKFDLPRPENWILFEDLCLKLWGYIWQIPHLIDFNSTNVQGQEGVDIIGIPKNESGYFGIQCKSKKLQLKSGQLNKITKIDINWKLIARDFHDSGTLKLIINPQYIKKQSIWIIAPGENGCTKNIFKKKQIRGTRSINW